MDDTPVDQEARQPGVNDPKLWMARNAASLIALCIAMSVCAAGGSAFSAAKGTDGRVPALFQQVKVRPKKERETVVCIMQKWKSMVRTAGRTRTGTGSSAGSITRRSPCARQQPVAASLGKARWRHPHARGCAQSHRPRAYTEHSGLRAEISSSIKTLHFAETSLPTGVFPPDQQERSEDQEQQLKIMSVFAQDHLSGYIYIEADKEPHVRHAIKGAPMIFPLCIKLKRHVLFVLL